ncbi:hypothetical protein B0H17DRAFT_1177751 [Mycena rosella]|uniref:Uncharacterized protein n=1 Tax=Mycena rosella TaxID=1033263 RepID=A0AAD7DQW0_MYCRO|nr:hypothetical protein B0H17DRAFT_1177751 [Mycena rosella]
MAERTKTAGEERGDRTQGSVTIGDSEIERIEDLGDLRTLRILGIRGRCNRGLERVEGVCRALEERGIRGNGEGIIESAVSKNEVGGRRTSPRPAFPATYTANACSSVTHTHNLVIQTYVAVGVAVAQPSYMACTMDDD